MIKVTVEQVLKVNPILGKLVNNSYAGRVAFYMARLAREITKEVEAFDKVRLEVVQKYADKDESGNLIFTAEDTVHISEENLASCNNELSEILKSEIELMAEPICEEWFENIELTIEEALALEPFIN